MTADYHRDAGNRQLVLGRCYELTAQVRQLSDAVAMGNTSAHQLLQRQLADKDNEIHRLLRTLRMFPVVSEFQRRSPFLVVVILLVTGQPMPGLTAAELSAFRSASETLRQGVLGIFGARGGLNQPPGTPAAPVTSALPSPRRLHVSPTNQASSRLPRSSSDDFGRRQARSPSFSRSSARSRSLSVEARGSQSAPSSATRNTIVRRPRSPSVARSGTMRRHSPDSDADSSGSALISSHASSRSVTSSRSHKKARATPTPSPVSSKKRSPKRSTNKKAAKSRTTVSHSSSEDSDDEAGLAPLRRPRRTAAANCSAIQRLFHAGESDSDSEVLGEAAAISSSSGHGRQASSGSAAVSSTCAPLPSSQVTLTSLTQASQESTVDLASVNSPVSSSMLAEDLEGADSSGVESSSTTKQAASTLASLSGATKSVVIRILPPGKHPVWIPGNSDSGGGDSTGGGSAATSPNLAGSGSPPLASPTVAVRPPQVTTSAPVSAAVKAPVSPKTPPPARSPVCSATSTPQSNSASKAKAVVPARSAKDASKPKPASKAKPTAAIPSAKDGSKPKSASKPSAGMARLSASDAKARTKSDGGVPPHHIDVKVLVARAAASAWLDSRVSGPIKRLRELPFFHKGSKRCWEKIMSYCAVSVTMEKTADGERIKPTPCSITGLAAFMDVDDSGHTWRSVLRLLPHSLFFVDGSVLEVCPPVEKGKRSKKPGSLLEVLSHEWCKSRGVVRKTSFSHFGSVCTGSSSPATADLIAEATRIDNHEPWRLWWPTAPGRHPYNTIFLLYHPEFRLFVPEGADSEMIPACVEDLRLITEPEPPALHPNTPAPVNRAGDIEFCSLTIAHSA
ncbi:unnamed protein product [Phytophthora fragariaefolia]|uniref:Unnamed protein product n=1 Tax=Phytophthora fragariaefolia TaxID=1490495 RepID=A0A9W6WYA6_9STRA|nr:unnamed protein product [Phytophthora fragariaefolia]